MKVTSYQQDLRPSQLPRSTPASPGNSAQPAAAPVTPGDSTVLSSSRPVQARVSSAAVGALVGGVLCATAYAVAQTAGPVAAVVMTSVLAGGGAALMAAQKGGDVKSAALSGLSLGAATGMLMSSPDVASISPLLRGGACAGTVGGLNYLFAK